VATIVLSMFAVSPALANCGNDKPVGVGNGCAVGAPAPLLGAGLPGLGIAFGYGAYWFVRRRRKAE